MDAQLKQTALASLKDEPNLYPPRRAGLGDAAGAVRAGRGDQHLWCRLADRREPGRVAEL